MVGYFALGIAVLSGLLLASRWLTSTDPKTLARTLKWLGIGAVAIVAIWLAVTGRLAWALGVATMLLPWLMQFRRVARTAKNYSRMSTGAPAGQTSDVETRFLRMSLDHDSGALDGEVLEGAFAGRRLTELSSAELVELLRTCWVEDQQSAQVLEAYLDRVYPEWREQAAAGEQAGGASMSGDMSREEAYAVLGLEPGASEEDIRAAHHRLIANLHPDRGGSTFLAAKINQAKDILLGR